jgi:hypothetical protein
VVGEDAIGRAGEDPVHYVVAHAVHVEALEDGLEDLRARPG